MLPSSNVCFGEAWLSPETKREYRGKSRSLWSIGSVPVLAPAPWGRPPCSRGRGGNVLAGGRPHFKLRFPLRVPGHLAARPILVTPRSAAVGGRPLSWEDRHEKPFCLWPSDGSGRPPRGLGGERRFGVAAGPRSRRRQGRGRLVRADRERTTQQERRQEVLSRADSAIVSTTHMETRLPKASHTFRLISERSGPQCELLHLIAGETDTISLLAPEIVLGVAESG